MADDDGAARSTAVWPIPKFSFEVRWAGEVMSFQEVSGLDVEAQPSEFRGGNSLMFSPQKMPGLQKRSAVTLKRGVFRSDNRFWDWFNALRMNTEPRETMTVALLDETGSPTMVWTLSNAFPTKLSAPTLEATGNDVAIETLVTAHDGLTIADG
jgi:phage tail-like protein